MAAIQQLLEHGISCNRGVGNAHQEPVYAGRANWAKEASETLAQLLAALQLADVERVGR